MKKTLLLTCSALLCMGAVSGKSVRVIVSDNTGTRLICKNVFAADPNNSFISKATLSPSDTTFVFSEEPPLPFILNIIIDNENQDTWSDMIKESRDTIMSNLPVDYTTTALPEVHVTADPRLITDRRTLYKPTAQQKRSTHDGAGLLLAMGIPELRVNPVDNTVSTLTGEDVSYFIDYLPATPEEVANLRTADVKSVEIFQNPVDPVFRGALNVVNFILVKYDYGGYTKITGRQRFITPYTNGQLASRFSRGNMIFDLSADVTYGLFKHNGSVKDGTYAFPAQTLKWREETSSPRMESDNESVYLRMVYGNAGFTMTHTVGLSASALPWYTRNMQTTYSLAAYPDAKGRIRQMSRELSPYWTGSFYFMLPRGWTFSLDPSLAYGRNKSGYAYDTEISDLVNDARENTWYARLRTDASKSFHGSHRVGLSLVASDQHYDIDYAGTSNTGVTSNEFEFNVSPSLTLGFPGANVYATTGVGFITSTVDSERYTDLLLRYYVGGAYSINRKNRITVSSQLNYITVPMSQRSPNMIVNSELEARKGNPALKPTIYTSQVLQYLYFPTPAVSLSAFGKFERHTRAIAVEVTPLRQKPGTLLVTTNVNSGFQNILTTGISAGASLLNNRLTFGGDVSYSCMRRHGIQNLACDHVTFSAYGNWYFGNFYLQPYYSHSTRTYSNVSTTWAPSSYQVSLGWSNGRLNISASARNFVRSDWKSGESVISTGNYTMTNTSLGGFAHRAFQITASYSFSYGKKVNGEMQPQSGPGIRSGIMK